MLAVVCPIEGAVPERYGQLIDTVLQNAKKVSGDKCSLFFIQYHAFNHKTNRINLKH